MESRQVHDAKIDDICEIVTNVNAVVCGPGMRST